MRRFISASVIMLLAVTGAGQEQTPSEGTLSLHLQTSSFEAPLFESQYSTSASLFFAQRLPGGERLSLFGSQSRPSSITYLTLELSDLRWLGGTAEIAAGDIGTEELLPRDCR